MGISTNNIEVQVVLRKNGFLLAEWKVDGAPKRAWVTPDMVVVDAGSTATVSRPEAGIPYGMDFSRLELVPHTAADIDRELKIAGIWTTHDVRNRPNEVLGALLAACGIELAQLLNFAKEYEKSLGGPPS